MEVEFTAYKGFWCSYCAKCCWRESFGQKGNCWEEDVTPESSKKMLKVKIWERWGAFIVCLSKVCWAYILLWIKMHLGAFQRNHSFYFCLVFRLRAKALCPLPLISTGISAQSGDLNWRPSPSMFASLPQVKCTARAYSQTLFFWQNKAVIHRAAFWKPLFGNSPKLSGESLQLTWPACLWTERGNRSILNTHGCKTEHWIFFLFPVLIQTHAVWVHVSVFGATLIETGHVSESLGFFF